MPDEPSVASPDANSRQHAPDSSTTVGGESSQYDISSISGKAVAIGPEAKAIYQVQHHWHANEISEEMQLAAVQLFAEAAVTTFVDLMRLLTVRSSPHIYRHNHERYDEFVTTAELHLQDVDRQLQRFSSSLPTALLTSSNLIERQLNWGYRRLMKKPERALLEPAVFSQMQQMSADIHDFCLRAKHSKYLVEWQFVETELAHAVNGVTSHGSQIPIDDFIMLRFETQQRLLEKRKGLQSVSDDATYELSFLYYAIDYHLLLFAT